MNQKLIIIPVTVIIVIVVAYIGMSSPETPNTSQNTSILTETHSVELLKQIRDF